MRRAAALLALTTLAACRGQAFESPDPTLERMQVQPRVDPYAESDFFRNRMAMQRPPAGTVPRDRVIGDPALTLGILEGETYVTTIPVPVTNRLLARGRDRFDIFCAACHGPLGDGRSPVAASMALRKPSSLQDADVRAYPPGRLYDTIRRGFGLMPAYDAVLAIEDRWAVVAYVRALQRSQHARVADLPPELQRELAKEAP